MTNEKKAMLMMATNAIILQYMAPIVIMLISILFLHQKAQKREIRLAA